VNKEASPLAGAGAGAGAAGAGAGGGAGAGAAGGAAAVPLPQKTFPASDCHPRCQPVRECVCVLCVCVCHFNVAFYLSMNV